jgi:hypothetical protein
LAVYALDGDIDFGPMVPQLPDILGTPERKIRLAPQYLLDDLPRLAKRLDRPPDELVLVSRRHLRITRGCTTCRR